MTKIPSERTLNSLGDEFAAAKRFATVRSRRNPVNRFAKYQGDPVAYARHELKVDVIWDVMAEAAESLFKPPYKLLLKSGHKLGKTFFAAWMVNYFFDCFDPGVVITTGPSYESMCDTLWTEIRIQRLRGGLPNHFIGDSAPEMRTSPDHFAKGVSTRKSESFHGKHHGRMLFVFDEAGGVDRPIWTVVKTMHKPQDGYGWLASFNPTDPTCTAYQEEQSGEWQTISLASLNHPNVTEALAGRPEPIPNAVTLEMVNGWVREWCKKVADEPIVGDVEWPPGSGEWWRPYGPEFESRCLGVWPSQSSYAVWPDGLWSAICGMTNAVNIMDVPFLGVDVARYGDDKTAFHTRWTHTSLFHESAQGWALTRIVGRIVEICRMTADYVNALREQAGGSRPILEPEQVNIQVDDDGLGGGVTDRLMELGYNVTPIRSGQQARNSTRYPNKRSEMWFSAERRAEAGGVSLGLLPKEVQQTLRVQAMSPKWAQNSSGQRVVEKKEDTKARIGRSPDNMDAFNLAYYETGHGEAPEVLDVPIVGLWDRQSGIKPMLDDDGDDIQERPTRSRKLFGR